MKDLGKREIFVFLTLVLLLSISISFASAFWPFDYFKKTALTGKAVDQIPLPNGNNCVDSDGGIFSKVSGEVSFRKKVGGYKSIYNDTCTTRSSIKGSAVIEYSCNSKVRGSKSPVESRVIPCPNGCKNGACSNAVCTDSDGGNNINLKGTAKLSDGTSKTDVCYDTTKLTEYYCYEDGSKIGDISRHLCENGCKDGACVAANVACTDSDGGLNYIVSGTIVNATATKNDYCSSADETLLEYSCTFGGSITPYRCTTIGKVCRNGACV